ncbi:MAG: hypothetical protein VR72_04130 [Clostridiaceae bacterium BRH_c20a]|nr:MAG: hypothetical protein VR72_04130 [Clostridiaceae bacterium BRH_c20a]
MSGLRIIENIIIAILIFTIGISLLFSFQIESNFELYKQLNIVNSQLEVMGNASFNDKSNLTTNESISQSAKFNKLFYLIIGLSLIMYLKLKKENFKVKIILQYIFLVSISLSVGVLLAIGVRLYIVKLPW